MTSTLRARPFVSLSRTTPSHRQVLANGSCRLNSHPHPPQCRTASSSSSHSFATDPAETEALLTLEDGTRKLEEGDAEAALALYQRSVNIKRTASSLFNLGVAHYHLKTFSEAVKAWKEAIKLQPDSPDAHTNLASAYIMSPPPRPDLALHHLRTAASLAPDDAEIAFNLAAVLEACGHLEPALQHYKRAKAFGVDRADLHIRNVSAKILGKRMREAEQRTGADGDKSAQGSS